MKTAIKCLAWVAAMIAISLAIMYGFWLVLIFFLFGETLWLWLTVAGELLLVAGWIYLMRIAEC